jgi:hypothetical protein
MHEGAPTPLPLFGAHSIVDAGGRVFGDSAEHGPRRALAPEPARFVSIGVHSWSLNGRRERFFQHLSLFRKISAFRPLKDRTELGPVINNMQKESYE